MTVLTWVAEKATQFQQAIDQRLGRSNKDNFETNQITVADHDDASDYQSSSVLGLSAVWSCVNLIAGTMGSLPIMVYNTTRTGVDEENWDHPLYRVIAESPNADQTPLDFFEFASASVELQGNAYSEIERGGGGRVISLQPPIPGDRVTVRRIESGALQYEWTDAGKRRSLPQENVLHVRGFGGGPLGGMSTLAFGGRSFSSALAIERAAAKTFRNGVRASGAFVAERHLTPAQMVEAQELIDKKYTGAMNAGRPLLLNSGMKFEQLTVNPEDAQMLESRSFSVEEICRFFGVPPHMVGHTEKTTSWGTGLEQQTLGFIIFTLRRRLKRFEQSMAKQLLTPADRAKGLKIKFDLRGLMRGDSKARAQFYQLALQCGWMTINEVRSLEGLPPVPGGDIIRLQAQNIPITEETDATEDNPSAVNPGGRKPLASTPLDVNALNLGMNQ